MRVSALPGDPGYRRDYDRFRVFLNDRPLEHCYAADEEQGVAWVYIIEEGGGSAAGGDGGSMGQMLRGKVEITHGTA